MFYLVLDMLVSIIMVQYIYLVTNVLVTYVMYNK